MSKQAENARPVNIKQEPAMDALAEVIAMMIRAQENGKEIFKNDIQTDR